MKSIFSMEIHIDVFYKLILSFWGFLTRPVHVPKIKSLHIAAISPEKHGVDFLPPDKHKSFLQDGSITLNVYSQAC